MSTDQNIRRFKRCQGFTIVEALVSLCVLGFSLVAIFGTLNMCSTTAHHTRMLSQAVCLAENLMVRTKLKEITTFNSQTGEESLYRWTIEIVPTPMNNLGVVWVKIAWVEQNRTRQYHLRSLARVRSLRS